MGGRLRKVGLCQQSSEACKRVASGRDGTPNREGCLGESQLVDRLGTASSREGKNWLGCPLRGARGGGAEKGKYGANRLNEKSEV